MWSRSSSGDAGIGSQRFESLKAGTILLCACLSTYLLYHMGLPGGFLLDDIIRLPRLEPDSLALPELIRETLIGSHGRTGRPVSVFTLVLTKALSGPAPAAFKYHNILLHLLTGLVQFWALAYLLGLLQRNDIAGTQVTPCWVPAAFLTALWLVHPLFVSTVLYSVQRSAILSALFVWCSILCYTIARQALMRNRVRFASILLFIGVPVSALLGLGSKADAALLLVYLLLINVFVELPFGSTRKSARNIATMANIILIAIPLVIGGIYILTNLGNLLSGYEFRTFSLLERVLTQGYLIWWYASLIFIPLIRRMSLYHDNHWIASIENIPAYVAITSLIVLTILALNLRKRIPAVGFGILLFLSSHIMESTIFSLELVFEHRNYAGSMGLFIAAYGAWKRLAPNTVFSKPAAKSGLFALAFISLSSLLGLRSWTWADNRNMIMSAVLEQPRSTRALTELVNIHLRDNEFRKAFSLLNKSVNLTPQNAGPYIHMLSFKCVGEISQEKENTIKQAIKNNHFTPYAISGLENLQNLALTNECSNVKPEEIIRYLDLALRNTGLSTRSLYHIYIMKAKVLASMDKYEEALSYSHQAIELIPDIPLNQKHIALIIDASIARKAGNKKRIQDVLLHLEDLQKLHPYYFRHAHPELKADIVGELAIETSAD